MSSSKKLVSKKVISDTTKVPSRLNKKTVILLFSIMLVGFGFSFIITRHYSAQTKNATISPAAQGVYNVDIKKENKDPIDLLIKKGESVQFNSKDGGQHQIVQGGHGNTEHGKGLLDSGVFNGDEAYLLKFKEIGKYEFHDNYDHDFTVTVLVYDPNKSPEETKLKP